jgi:hypothetical protein
MPIKVRCSTCGARLKAPDAAAGRPLDCPHCSQVVSVPKPAAAPPPSVAGRGETADVLQKPDRSRPPPSADRHELFEQLAHEIEDNRSHRLEAASVEDTADADGLGALGLAFAAASALCLLAGCLTMGLSYWGAAPFAAGGAGCAFFSQSRLRIIGLVVNLLLLIPAIFLIRTMVAAAVAPELPPQPFVR